MTPLLLLLACAYADPSPYLSEKGAHLVLAPTDSAAEITVRMRYAIGTGDDPEAVPQQAHLIEHLFFRGKTPGGAVRTGALEAHNCTYDATTSWHDTEYRFTCPASDAAWLVDFVVGGIRAPLNEAAQAHVDIEHAVVWHEYRYRHTDPRNASRERIRAAFPADSAPVRVAERPPPPEEPPSLETLVEATARYAPATLSVAVTGNFDASAAEGKLAAALGGLRRWEGTSEPPAPLQLGRAADRNLHRPEGFTELPTYSMTWPVQAGPDQGPALSALASLVSAQLTAKLAKHSKALDQYCSASYITDNASTLTCSVAFVGDPKGLTPILRQALIDVRTSKLRTGFARYDRRTQRAFEESSEETERDTELTSALLLADVAAGRTPQLRPPAPLGHPTTVKSIRSNLWPEHAATQWFQPGDATPNQTPGVQAASMAEAEAAPQPPSDISINELKSATRTLPSGLTILAAQTPGTSRLSLHTFFNGGLGGSPSMLAESLGDLHISPFGKFPYSLYQSIARDHTALRMEAPNRQATSAMRMYVEALQNLRTTTPSRDLLQQRVRLQQFLVRKEHRSPDRIAARFRWETVTPNHEPTAPLTLEELDARLIMGRSVTEMYHEQVLQPGNAVMIALSPDDPDTVLDQLERQARRWKASPGIAPVEPRTASMASVGTPDRWWLQHENAKSSLVNWACPLPPGLSEAEVTVLDTAIDTLAFAELRSKQGLSYTPSGSASWWPDGTATLDLAMGTTPSLAESAAQAVESLGAALPERLDAHLQEARQRTLRETQLTLRTATGVAEALYRTARAGEPSLNDHLESIASVDLSRLRTYAEACTSAASIVVTSTEAAPEHFKTHDVETAEP